MDTLINFGQLAQVLQAYGPYGLLIVVWYFDQRKISAILNQHKSYMDELRNMYESNVRLVEGYETIAKDFKDLIIMNTQNLTHLTDDIRQNQYCPAVRVEKQTIKVAAK